MKELRCALALALVGLVSATPYGYGVKGGAAGAGGAAKAVANAGAISSVSGLPLSIPSGAGFSGSFSNSASSSFSSSSASSSSGSYTFSGSGAPSLTGFGNGATGGCATGGCQTGAKDISGLGANGLQGYNAAGAVAGAGAGALTGAGYTIKDDSAPCVTGDCSKKYGSASGNYNAQLPKEAPEKSEADALSEISSTDDIDITKCKSGKCGSIPQGSPSTDYGSNDCASGQCGPNSQTGTSTGSAPAAGTSAGAYGSNKICASGQCETSSLPDTLTKPYESDSKCTSGQCGSKPENEIPAVNYGSDNKCASGQCGQGTPTSTGYGSHNKCASGQCGISSQPASHPHSPDSNCALGNCGATPPAYHGSDSKPTSYHVGSTVHPEIPSTSYGHPVATSPITGINNKCISGNCSPNTLTGPAVPKYGPYDIPVTGSKATYNSDKDTSNFDKTSDVSVDIKSDCFLGNCGPSTVATYQVPVSNPHPASGKPNDGPLNYGYNPTPLGGLNKPATYLTTPKLQANYVTGPSNYNTPGSYSPSLHADKPCSTGNCDLGKPSTPFANSGSYSSNYGSSKYPNTILPSGSSEAPCSTPNCAPNVHPHDYPKAPSYASAPGYQVPAGLGTSNVPASCTSGNCATYPSPSNTGYGIASSVPAAPSPSYGQTTSHATTGSAAVAGLPSLSPISGPSPIGSKYPSFAPSYTPISTSSGCNTPNCSPYPSPNPGAIHSTPSVVSISKPSVDDSSDKNLPPYTGGFGGPAGLLKPYENITPGVPSNTYNKPTVPSNVYHPTGSNSYNQPTVPTGTYSPSAPNSYNKPAAPTGPSEPTACSSGNCGTPSGQPAHPHVQSVPTPSSGSQVVHGPSIASTIPQAVSGAVAGAHAEAEGIIYTGGFGGPPGLLKPYDGGKIDSTGPIKYPSNSLINLPHSTSGSATPGSYGTSYNKLGTAYPAAGSNVGVGAGASAQAGAVAGTSSAIGGTNDHGFGGHIGTNIHEQKGSSGCGVGCGSSTGGSYSAGFGLSTGQGLSKIGQVDGLGGGLSASGATAKSLAGAVSGANTFGTSGSFASSAASAHASAGAGVKGGYYG